VTRKDEITGAQGEGFDVSVEEVDAAMLIRVRGELDLGTHEELREPLVKAAGAEKSVVVDLSECEFIDSSGIRALLLGHEAVTGNDGDGQRVLIAAPQPQVMRVLEMTGVGEAIPVHESVDQALSSLS
jgi:anti-sigma B factor antagonist